ncbi:MAG: hypothetical protein DRG78_13680 [Epsilonproteobacteria bacterium]|nr:MAG: hypothetical protein DRG78_13680 [Campylobacterota bacterium]
MSQEKTESKVLSGIEHVRLRPQMYAGDLNTPDHLLTEILDNSLDELVNGFASVVTVDIRPNGYAVLADNGRGIKVEPVLLPDGTTADSIIALTTQLFSSGKFDTDIYDISIGLHGVGLVVVNSLSLFLNVSVRDRVDKDIIHHYSFKEAEFISKETFSAKEHNIQWSTRIEFQVDPKYVTINTFTESEIKTRLNLVAAHYPTGNLFFGGVMIPKVSFVDYVRKILGVSEEADILSVSVQDGIEELIFFFTYDGDMVTPSLLGDINLDMCEGTYISIFTSLLTKKVKELGYDLTKNEILNHFRCYISGTIREPKFDNQIKTKMVKNLSKFVNTAGPSLINELDRFKSHFELIISAKNSSKAVKSLRRKSNRVSSENPLKDCLRTPGEILYILEGESAAGPLKDIRDIKTEAILPVTGKILNAVKHDLGKAVESKKMKFLLEALGVGKDNFRYEKIKIIADADPDGLHINILVALAIWRYAPKLIEDGRVSIILPPLYGVTEKKTKVFTPIYSLERLQQYDLDKYNSIRFKGLGEMNSDQLEAVIKLNTVEYVLEIPKSTEEQHLILECLTNTKLKRSICQKTERFGLDVFLSRHFADNV